MKHNFWVVLFVLILSAISQAALTVHIQSPWRDDASKSGYAYYLTGNATGIYWIASDAKSMTEESDGWFSYVWDRNPGSSFSLKACKSDPDANVLNSSCVESSALKEVELNSLFTDGVEEVWLYTTTSAPFTYKVTADAPGSKIVWFKSPWGNKALPQMIFGQDSVLMYFKPDDESSCGWFFGAISPTMMKSNPVKAAHFIRYLTPYFSIPVETEVELAEALSMADTIFVDGTKDIPEVSLEIGELGECFDSSRTLHVYHPWRTNTTYRDSAVYISVGSNIVNNATAMDNAGDEPFWWHYDFPMSIKSTDWNSCNEWGALVNFYSSQNGGRRYWIDGQTRPCITSFFPKGVYETWVYTKDNGKYETLYSPLERKVVRLLSPWENMAPMMLLAGDTLKMGPISKDTCGWYQAMVFKHIDAWDVMFRQAFGFEHYTAKGLGDGDPIVMDSIMALHDTVWIVATGLPKFSEVYPGRLGICPTMKISALVVDWAGEGVKVPGATPYSRETDFSMDVDFGGIYDGNEYTLVTYLDSTGELATNQKCQGLVTGMVQDTLVNGLPARVDSSIYPWDKCSAAHEIEKWFIPVEIAKDAHGNSYTNGVCRDIDLSLDEEGFWLADISESHEEGGFFPVDDLEYLDSARTVRNPKFDWDDQLTAGGKKHNYSFAMKISAQFQYVKGQYFEFRGDDDVWVYINNRLVVDIGGCHSPIEGFVDLDTLGLEEGKEYPFHIFFSERNATGSNFKMRTSINLKTQKSFYTEEQVMPDGSVMYSMKQLLIDESLSCDVSSVTKIDTSDAQTVFVLVGGKLPADGATLEPGLNYGGIYINETMTGFNVDTSAFVNSRMLEPGTYALICYLAADQNQYEVITFTVPEYPLPDIAFVDVFNPGESFTALDPTGLSLRGQPLGVDPKSDTLLAHVTYPDMVPLKIALMFGPTTPCGDMEVKQNCTVTLEFKTSSPLVFLDKDNQRVTSITTDDMGYASFYVVGDSAMVDAFFTVSGQGVGNELIWKDIHFKEPPVPFASRAQMHDRNGDGIPDSLFIPFSKPFDDVVPDTLSWVFGGTASRSINGMENVWPLVYMDSNIVVEDMAGLRAGVFTGLNDGVYNGSLNYHYTYMDEDSGDSVKLMMNTSIEDKVGPIATSAVVESVNENISSVTITLSEGTSERDVDGAVAFEVFRDSRSFMDSLDVSSTTLNKNGNVIKIFFSRSATGNLPAVGDSIRLAPGEIKDLNGNPAHMANPKICITGEIRVEIKTPGVVTLGPDSEPWPYETPIAPVVVAPGKSVQEIIEEVGKPGLLLPVDLSRVAGSMIADLPSDANVDSAMALVKINWESYYFSHLGNYVNDGRGVIACNDKTIFYNAANPEKSNCIDNPGNIFFEWNGRSDKGRLVGTGAYISKMKVKVLVGKEKVGSNDDVYTLGIKRGK